MSGRIETYGSQKEQTSKWSKNESMTVKEAGVDIEKDPEEKRPSSYLDLTDKPSINGISLVGNKSLDELYIQKKLTAGKGISIEYDENYKLVISEVPEQTETSYPVETPGVLGWVNMHEVYKRNGIAQVKILCGTNGSGITGEMVQLFTGLPEPDVGSSDTPSVSLIGECEGTLYRFIIQRNDDKGGVVELISRNPIPHAWKEISIVGTYLCK